MQDKALEAAARAIAACHGDPDGWEWFDDLAEASVRAYLAQREAGGAVMCPVEPSEEMLEQADQIEPRETWYPDEPGARNTPDQIYRAMIAARPRGD